MIVFTISLSYQDGPSNLIGKPQIVKEKATMTMFTGWAVISINSEVPSPKATAYFSLPVYLVHPSTAVLVVPFVDVSSAVFYSHMSNSILFLICSKLRLFFFLSGSCL